MLNLVSIVNHFAATKGECGSYTGIVDTSCLPHPHTANSIPIMLNIVFGIAAAIALLMVVIGGFRYITARGDPNGTAQARSAILYAIIGLIVTMAAYSLVFFIIRVVL